MINFCWGVDWKDVPRELTKSDQVGNFIFCKFCKLTWYIQEMDSSRYADFRGVFGFFRRPTVRRQINFSWKGYAPLIQLYKVC